MFQTFVRNQKTATKTKQNKWHTYKETHTKAKKHLLLVAKTLATAKKPRRHWKTWGGVSCNLWRIFLFLSFFLLPRIFWAKWKNATILKKVQKFIGKNLYFIFFDDFSIFQRKFSKGKIFLCFHPPFVCRFVLRFAVDKNKIVLTFIKIQDKYKTNVLETLRKCHFLDLW